MSTFNVNTCAERRFRVLNLSVGEFFLLDGKLHVRHKFCVEHKSVSCTVFLQDSPPELVDLPFDTIVMVVEVALNLKVIV